MLKCNSTPSIGEYLPGTWLNIATDLRNFKGQDVIESPVLVLSLEGMGKIKSVRLLDKKCQLLHWSTDLWSGPIGMIHAASTRRHPLGFRVSPLSCTPIHPLVDTAPILAEAKKIRSAYLRSQPHLKANFFSDDSRAGFRSRI